MDLPAHKFLEEHGIPHRRLEFPMDTDKGAANVAHALGYAEAQMVKTLIFETAAGERALVMLGGDKNAISGRLKRALGSRNIRLADPETVKTVTGYEIGSIPPFHWQPPGFRSVVDECLMREAVLGVGAGVWGQEIMIAPADLVAACTAEVFDLSGNGQAGETENRVRV
jgi:Cys-tRNA(Pro)/Cys-tRNA(Cys) deacylase